MTRVWLVEMKAGGKWAPYWYTEPCADKAEANERAKNLSYLGPHFRVTGYVPKKRRRGKK